MSPLPRLLCAALARLLATRAGLRTARWLQAAGRLGRAPSPPEAPLPRPRRPEPISIWQPREIDGEPAFVRPDPLPLGDHYAAARVLRPKRAELPLRVALFGESVAAGYLYAPHLTPAQVLEAQLRAAGGEASFEVVDLARTNETLGSLAETVRTSLQINPDVLVLFAGNNWNLLETPEISPYAPSVSARLRYARALREEGTAGPLRLAAEELREKAEAVLAFIAALARAVHVPVVTVIPEVNLADWETRQPPVWLPGGGIARWYELYGQAREALEQGSFAAALAAGRAMQELDGGACPTSWRLLARAWAGLEDGEAARRTAAAEVDAAAYPLLAFLSAPQATSAAREILCRCGARHGFRTIDLREVFAQHTGSPLPGRRLFLDYCHLTVEGIQVAMAAVAAAVLDLSGMRGVETDWRRLLPELPAPAISPAAEATARLGAAVHTAHRLLPVGPKRPLLEHWCAAALDACPEIEAAMLDLVAARCAPCPAVLTAAQQRNLASPCRLLLQHGWRWEHLDADLIEAIAAVLERRGRPAREQITRLLLRHLAIRGAGTDLSEPPYLWEPLERFYPEAMRFADLAERATLRAPWPESSFCLICDAARDVELALTVRLPAAAPGRSRRGRIAVAVNGREAGGVEAAERWTRAVLRVDRARLRSGLNRLTLAWPMPEDDGESGIAAAVSRLELGLAADLHPVFGEIFSLVARSLY
jgi:hypothetical protein